MWRVPPYRSALPAQHRWREGPLYRRMLACVSVAALPGSARGTGRASCLVDGGSWLSLAVSRFAAFCGAVCSAASGAHGRLCRRVCLSACFRVAGAVTGAVFGCCCVRGLGERCPGGVLGISCASCGRRGCGGAARCPLMPVPPTRPAAALGCGGAPRRVIDGARTAGVGGASGREASVAAGAVWQLSPPASAFSSRRPAFVSPRTAR